MCQTAVLSCQVGVEYEGLSAQGGMGRPVSRCYSISTGRIRTTVCEIEIGENADDVEMN